MGKIKSCYFDLKDRQAVYRPGETVCGKVTLEIERDLKVQSLVISCHGQALTKWSKLFQRATDDDAIGMETYVNSALSLLKRRDDVHILTAGKHSYDFKFQLPSQGIPSSFEGSLGSVRYWLKMEVVKPFPAINNKFYGCFTVLAHLDANLTVYRQTVNASAKTQLSKALGIGDAGTLSLSASLDRSGYCPGEKISINLEAKNESTKDLGQVKASLVQRVDYTAGNEKDCIIKTIRTLQSIIKLSKGEKGVWNKQLLFIDAVPPSTKRLTCQIIKVTYHVLITVEVPLGLDLKMQIPIKLCSIPLGASVPAKPCRATSGLFVISNSRSLSYSRCLAGVQNFNESNDNFVNINYNPFTCFVTNYNPVQTTEKPQALTAVRTAAQTSQTTTATKPSTSGTVSSPKVIIMPTSSTTKTAQTLPPPAGVPQPSKELEAGTPVPSAPRMGSAIQLEPPPSYETACAPARAVSLPSNMPMPYYLLPEPGKGSFLLLQFPVLDVSRVSAFFKNQIANMLLHDGKVMMFVPELQFVQSQQTAAILIHFGAERTALSWLQNMISVNPELTCSWWAMLGENSEHLENPGDLSEYTAISLTLLKRKSEFRITNGYLEEYNTLLEKDLRPARARNGGKTIFWGKVIFACGNWSFFPAKAAEVNLTVTQFPSLDSYATYLKEFTTEPKLVRTKEMVEMANDYLFRSGFNVGNVSMFQSE